MFDTCIDEEKARRYRQRGCTEEREGCSMCGDVCAIKIVNTYMNKDRPDKVVLPKVTVFLPNEKELQALTGAGNLQDAIHAVLPYLGGLMVVKCGSRGSLLVRKDGSCQQLDAFLNADVVDAIGAGDSFNSGFVSAFVKGMSPEECQVTGNLTGAVNTPAAGGTGAFTSLEAVRRICKERFGRELPL